MCPTCQRPVAIDREDMASCGNCDMQFATRDATTLVEYRATRHLAQALEDAPAARRGMSATGRWVVTGGVLSTIAATTAVFGSIGFAVSGTLTLGLLALASARTGGGSLR
jgi:uncharacterized protein GlcG (DUF336 family)